jgi:hypothetical protein
MACNDGKNLMVKMGIFGSEIQKLFFWDEFPEKNS